MQSSEGPLQDPPRDRLGTARLSHQHGRVSGVFGLVELDDFGHGERGHLQTALTQLHLHGILQLKREQRPVTLVVNPSITNNI